MRLLLICMVASGLVGTAHADELEQIRVTVHDIDRREHGARIVYTVRNGSSPRADRIEVHCSLYDAGGKPVGARDGSVRNVAPEEEVVGQVITFVTNVASANCRPTDITSSKASSR